MSVEALSDTVRVFTALATPPVTMAVVCALGPGAVDAPRLDLKYPPPSGSLADAADILIVNARVAALVVGATLLAASVRGTATPLSFMLAGVATLNVAMVTIAIAADGTTATVALLPHVPAELLAFSVLGAGFLHARRHAAASRPALLVTTTVIGLVLLVLAAALEVTPL